MPLPDALSGDDGDAPSFGQNANLILDTNGDPAFVYLVRGADTPAESALWFRNWNRARYRWNEEVRVARQGNAPTYSTAVSLAQDRSNGVWALAYEDKNVDELVVVTSTDGVEWKRAATFPAVNAHAPVSPSLAVRDGMLFLSYVREPEGLHYVSSRYDPTTSSRLDQLIVSPAGAEPAREGVSTSLALDSKGVPAIAFWSASGDYNRVLGYWRPGMGAALKVTDTLDTQSDFLDVKMIFQGDNPRILFNATRSSDLYYEHDWVVRSEDGGGTWTNPVYIPRDGGNHAVDTPFDITVDRAGRGAVVFLRNGGSSDVCMGVKISRSDDLSNWTTCALSSGTDPEQFDQHHLSLQIRFAANDKLYVLWQQPAPTDFGRGLLLWREP